MDLFLVSDGNIESVKEPKVRVIWHIFFFSLIGFIVISGLTLPNLRSLFPNSHQVAMIWRLFCLSFYLFTLFLLCILAYRHYAYLLRTAKDIRFSNIIFFYTMGALLFASIYQALYLLKPSLFTMSNPIYIPQPYFMDFGYIAYLAIADFIVYSLSIMVSLEYPRIQSSSVVVSVVNIFEVLFAIAIIVLLVATFVQMSSQERKK